MTSTPRSIPVEVLSERRRVAEALRHFAAGRTTNREFERALETTPSSGFYDPVLDSVEHFAWLMYDDFETHRLDGKRKLSREARRAIARWVLFLRSDCESVEGPPEFRVQGTVFGCALYLWLKAAPLWAPIAICGVLWGACGALIATTIGLALLIGFGVFLRVNDQIFACDQAFHAEDKSVWPFRNSEEFRRALAHQTLLAGVD
ncbi:MAG: hypothetical protein H6812_09410 [Phycisphaeraceae bacterium]|nr:hypothetical protein [Phycisphaerales bacterium]MCB9843459.1 hypothetical protein [Phycisphaeraceae bacterium]